MKQFWNKQPTTSSVSRSISWGHVRIGMFGFTLLAALVPKFAQAEDLGKIATGKSSSMEMEYPPTKKDSVKDDYHGTSVEDPYRWLEDTESDETAAWVKAQNGVTFCYLESIAARKKIHARLTSLWNYERFAQPVKYGERYFYSHNNGLQNQSVLYTSKSLEATREMLLDPNNLREDGTVSLSGWVPSDDGKHLAYGLAASGSDWNTWIVRDVASGKDTEDKLEWVKFSSVSWTKDGAGFFYSRFDEPKEGQEYSGVNYYQKLYYHRLGTSQSKDQLIYERKDEKEWGFSGIVSDDGDYLVIIVSRGTEDKKLVFYAELSEGKVSEQISIRELVTKFEWDYDFLGNDGSVFYFYTDNQSPKGRVIAVDTKKASPEQWKIIVPESAESIQSVSLLESRLFVNCLQDATSVVRRYKLDGTREEDLKLPGLGTVVGFGGKRKSKETFYSFTNYITPPTIYRLDLTNGRSDVWRSPKIDYDPTQFVTERVFYKSKDGTRIPMILSYMKGLKKDGDNPTMLYAYGGFNISLTPTFSASNIAWMEMGGIYAVANLRGGGEYGREWHEAGMLSHKQNVFDDFISAAEHLIAEKYTQPKRLAISGRSNGGLLVGAAMTQRPELFAVALPGVGVMDMLRFHKFTIGWAWVNEFGSSDDPDQFKNLIGYSPLHNLKSGVHYPATLVTTADHDDRVVPGHSFKFAAQLQAVQSGPAPTLIRIETRAGHGAGTPITKLIDAAADSWAFVARNVGMDQ